MHLDFVKFIKEIPFKKSLQKIEIAFNLIHEIPLNFILNKKMNMIGNRFKSQSDQKRNRLQFYIGNPFKN